MKYLFYGAEDGVYLQNLECFDDDKKIERVLELPMVTGLQILSTFQLLLVQTEDRLHCYHLPVFVTQNSSQAPLSQTSSNLKKDTWRPMVKVYSKNITFFKVGSIDGSLRIIAVKSRFASSTLKIYEPVLMAPGKSKKDFYYMEQCYGVLRLIKVFLPDLVCIGIYRLSLENVYWIPCK